MWLSFCLHWKRLLLLVKRHQIELNCGWAKSQLFEWELFDNISERIKKVASHRGSCVVTWLFIATRGWLLWSKQPRSILYRGSHSCHDAQRHAHGNSALQLTHPRLKVINSPKIWRAIHQFTSGNIFLVLMCELARVKISCQTRSWITQESNSDYLNCYPIVLTTAPQLPITLSIFCITHCPFSLISVLRVSLIWYPTKSE